MIHDVRINAPLVRDGEVYIVYQKDGRRHHAPRTALLAAVAFLPFR